MCLMDSNGFGSDTKPTSWDMKKEKEDVYKYAYGYEQKHAIEIVI